MFRVRSRGEPGFVVVLDNFHPSWMAERNGEPTPLYRANGQYIAIPTPGGEQEILLSFKPAWQPFAYAASTLGFLLLVAFAFVGWFARERH
jgi:hypothetical protein